MVFRRTPQTARAVPLVGAIVALDLLWGLVEGSTGTVAYGAVDEPAHFATGLVALMALIAILSSRPSAAFLAAALIASVAIDIDHIPAYLGWDGLIGKMPRPYSHSLLTVGVLLLAGRMASGRVRQVLLGAAFGIGAHLLRDLATGPGVSLLWPAQSATATMPYAIYFVALVAAVVSTAAQRGPAPRLRRRSGAPPLPSAYPPSGS